VHEGNPQAQWNTWFALRYVAADLAVINVVRAFFLLGRQHTGWAGRHGTQSGSGGHATDQKSTSAQDRHVSIVRVFVALVGKVL
jgi:hypothetical protein